MKSPHQQLIEAVALIQGIELTESDINNDALLKAAESQYGQRIRHQCAQDPCSWAAPYEVTDGGVLKVVGSIAVGFIGGGWIGGVLALGSALFGGNRQGNQSQRTEEEDVFNQTQGFSNGGVLAPAGGVVPVPYGSRSLSIDREGNECGGVRAGGFLLNSRIDTRFGRTNLYQLWGLGAGEDPGTNLGQIQRIATEELLFDRQPRSIFGNEEIKVLTRPGTQNQSAISWFPDYSQNISPSNYNTFGVDFRTEAGNPGTTNRGDPINGINASFSPDDGDITKTIDTDAWDANAWSEEPVTGNGFLSFQAGQVGVSRAIGFASFQGAQEWSDLAHGFYFTSSGFLIVEGGQVIASENNDYDESTAFRIETSENGQRLSYWKGEQRLHISSVVPSPWLYANIAFFGSSSRFDSVRTSSQRGGIKGEDEYRTTFEAVDTEAFQRLNAGDNYVLANGQPGIDASAFKIFKKDVQSREITTDSPVLLERDSRIFAWWSAVYETTKHVSAIELNFVFSVYARDNDGRYTTHGVMFDVWIRRADQQENDNQRVGRFYVRSRVPVDLYRAIRIENLPLGRYIVTIFPQTRDPKDEPVLELADNGTINNDDTSATFNGSRVRVEGEFQSISEPGNINSAIDEEMDYRDRNEISSDRGATGKLLSVNERVLPRDVGIPINGEPHRYPGICLTALRYEPSERISKSLTQSTPIYEGRAVRNLMSAGSASGLSSDFALSDPTADFSAEGLSNGWVLRNLSKGIESQIVAFDSTIITTAEALNWRTGDRYLVFFKRSSPFFPDIAADFAVSKRVGAGRFLDPDTDIDYSSFVYSRKHNKRNRFYWNSFAQEEKPFKTWFNINARSVMLFDSKINGRLALMPDEPPTNAPLVFNSSNSKDASLDWPSFESKVVNELVVRYTDMRNLVDEDGARGRTKVVTIRTREAHEGREAIVQQSIDMRSATSPLQCVDVGTVLFNSARNQNRGITFTANADATYIRGAEIIKHQFPSHEIGEEYSGFVVEVLQQDSITGTQRVRLNKPPVVFEGVATETADDGAVFAGKDLDATPCSMGDRMYNVSTKEYSFISGKSADKLTAGMTVRKGDVIEVYNLTAPPNLVASVSFRADGSSQDNIQYDYELIDGKVWVVLYGLSQAIGRLDPVNIGMPEISYRVQEVKPVGKATYSVSAAYYPGESLYSKEGLVFEYDGKVVFG